MVESNVGLTNTYSSFSNIYYIFQGKTVLNPSTYLGRQFSEKKGNSYRKMFLQHKRDNLLFVITIKVC